MSHHDCKSGKVYEHGGCPLCPPPVACVCRECQIPWDDAPDRQPRAELNHVEQLRAELKQSGARAWLDARELHGEALRRLLDDVGGDA